MSLAIRLYLSYNCSWCCVFFLVSVCFALFFCFLEIMLICVFLVVKAANMCTVSLLVRVDIWVCVCIGKYSRGRRTPRSSFVIITFVIHLFVFTPKGMKYKHTHTHMLLQDSKQNSRMWINNIYAFPFLFGRWFHIFYTSLAAFVRYTYIFWVTLGVKLFVSYCLLCIWMNIKHLCAFLKMEEKPKQIAKPPKEKD